MFHRRIHAACRVLMLIAAMGWGVQNEARGEETRPLVLVELFTSEGCSSCPPADKLLADLYASQPVDGATIVPMAFHVDYWDRLGWKDPYGDAAYSRRQRAYAGLLQSDSVYTPQMIVNGTVGFVGSDRGAAQNAIMRAGRDAPKTIEIDRAVTEGKKLDVDARISGVDVKEAILWAAVAEDELESEVTRGENRGRHLKHQAVVRVFKGEAFEPAAGGDTRAVSISLPRDQDWKQAHCRVIVAVQRKATGEILALGQHALKAAE